MEYHNNILECNGSIDRENSFYRLFLVAEERDKNFCDCRTECLKKKSEFYEKMNSLFDQVFLIYNTK